MYDFGNFGQRVQDLRKSKNMTQEELALKVGVSGQAVSKWENNQSYPDITLIPDLANIFEVEIAYLFGQKAAPMLDSSEFPPTYQGLPLVHSNNGVGCYSNKQVRSKQGSHVQFEDGSTAELATRMAINKGQGSVLFLTFESAQDDNVNQSGESKCFEFEVCRNVDIAFISGKCTIKHSADDKTRVYATGSQQFLQILEVSNDAQTELLKIGYRHGNYNDPNSRNNKLIIELPVDNGGDLRLCINGSGEIKSEISQFNTGNLTINGSGDIGGGHFTESCTATVNGSGNIAGSSAHVLKAAINGSGDICWGAANTANLNVNGSGDVVIGAVQQCNASVNGSGDIGIGGMNGGDFKGRISGSGDITINDGQCQKFDVEIVGSGDITAPQLTANTAHIVIHQSGTVELGRVIESSVEQIKKKGSIIIHHRGQQ